MKHLINIMENPGDGKSIKESMTDIVNKISKLPHGEMMQVISGLTKDLTKLCPNQEDEACISKEYCRYQKVVSDTTRETGMRIVCSIEEEALALAEEPIVPEDLPYGGRLK